MLRLLRTTIFLTSVVLIPTAALAGPIVVSTIGTFSWTDDPFFGPGVGLTNDSGLAGLPTDFMAVSLVLEGDFTGDGVTESETRNGYDSILGYADVNSWLESWSSLTSAVLTFRFNPLLPTGATAIDGQSAFSVALTGPAEFFLTYSYISADPPPDPSPVPEPSSLLLLAAGTAAMGALRRHRTKWRSAREPLKSADCPSRQ